MIRVTILLCGLLAGACSSANSQATPSAPGAPTPAADLDTQAAPPPGAGEVVAIFAGGCFWCMERPFEEIDGVISVLSGYTGGRIDGPSYEAVSGGGTGHAEAVRVLYDPARVTYEQLLETFWHNVDPTQRDAQFCDHGTQYRSGIFVLDAAQRAAAEASRARVDALIPAEIVTEITDAGAFWIAEDYHQDFHRTHPVRYTEYRLGCGRDARLQRIWGDLAGAH